MNHFPRTPLEETLPPFGALRAFFLKGSGGCAEKPVDIAYIFSKSLIVEQNIPTSCACLSTCYVCLSTFYGIFYTNAVFIFRRHFYLYLSLFKKKERKKEGPEGKTPIHGFEHLLKKASTGFTLVKPLTRGYPWNMFLHNFKELSVFFSASTHPRVVLPMGRFGIHKIAAEYFN